MYILGIESSANISAVALAQDRDIIGEYHFRHNMGLLRRLTPEIENMLENAEIAVSQLGAVAVSLGPGSFTGLRIGVTCAKTLTYALNIPVLGIPTLKAIAANIGAVEPDSVVCSLIFARADEVYYCMFDSSLNELCPCSIGPISELLSLPEADRKKIVFVGSGCRRHRELLKDSFGERALFAAEMCDFPRGLSIINLACDRLEKGESDDPAQLVPMYIKKPTPVIRKEAAAK